MTAAALGQPVLETVGLSCGYGQQPVLKDISLQLHKGEVLCILGPNGVGKTTLFKTLLGFLPPCGGSVLLGDRPTAEWGRREFAREIAYIPQLHAPQFSYTVHDVVLMGRTPHLQGQASPSRQDDEIARDALERLGISHLAARDYSALSGGERQMVLIARALAQQPKVMVMDEPCASLDFGNRARMLAQVLRLAEEGLSVVMTTHDPNHAFLLDGNVICLGRDGFVRTGKAAQVLTEAGMAQLYGVPVRVHAGADSVACVPLIGRDDNGEVGHGAAGEDRPKIEQ